jgi:BolA protein
VSSETVALLRQRLAVLEPLSLEIEDDSHRHAGHAGARDGGGHYNLTIVAAVFAGHNTVKRHRIVYEAAGELMRGRIHALSIRALAPDEV